MSTVIKVENLSKCYSIGTKEAKHDNLREVIIDTIKAPFRRLQSSSGGDSANEEDFWALKDVSFEVQEGDVIGIIGRNGAGKSTLLKILSKITEPTSGRVKIKGRIASLLEVGTGFHSELTGRENIYLNGAILGMSRVEINRKFDEIVAFSEIEKFLDTPVKRYSSGMYVRLAFAVAAHLDPEILIVDEVLAVGDMAFQKKCMGKMKDVSTGGRTILFVSHNTSAIAMLCNRSILLHQGKMLKNCITSEAIAYYLNKSNNLFSVIQNSKWIKDKGETELISVNILQNNSETIVLNCHEPFNVIINFRIVKPVAKSRLFLHIRNEKGETIFGTSDYDILQDDASFIRSVGVFKSCIEIPGNIFKVGKLFFTVGMDVQADRIVFVDDDVVEAEVIESYGGIITERHQRIGVIAPLLNWETIPITL